MLFTVTLYCSLAIFIAGTLFQAWKWFLVRIGPDAAGMSPWQRLFSILRGTLVTLFSRNCFSLFRVFIFDILLQFRILRRDFLRWLSHMLIFYGFILLLLMHALGGILTSTLFPHYESTLNPFLFLRNLFGVLVLVGIALAAYRRIKIREPKLFTHLSDIAILILLTVILISGFLLEGTKIISMPIFNQMVDDYAPMTETDDVQALQVYWVSYYGMVFPGTPVTRDPERLEEGRQVHEESCASCHSRPVAAFISFPLGQTLRPVAPYLNYLRLDIWQFRIHFLSCFLALALLPFTKFFHILSTPAGLMANAVVDREAALPANMATRRVLALNACTQCGDCTEHCSVAPVYQKLPNRYLLPSEKLLGVKAMVHRKAMSPETMRSLSEGSFLCTRCYRCTTVCPSGIYLQDLWIASSADLVERGFPEPHIWVRERTTADWARRIQYHVDAFPLHRRKGHRHRDLSDRSETFEACVQCQTCTNVCPVVACSDNPEGDLGITPQQIMNLLRIGLKELTLGSRMVWDCATCYSCQENCPEGIRVTDILYELRNMAYEKFMEVR